MKSLHWLALTLVVVGAINWGLVGLFNLDLVAALFGSGTGLARTVYTLVGVAGVVLLATSSAASRVVPSGTAAAPTV